MRKTQGESTEADVLARYPDLQSLADALRPLCTVLEAAEALRLSERSVRNYVQCGALRAARARDGSRVLIPRVEVLRHVAARL